MNDYLIQHLTKPVMSFTKLASSPIAQVIIISFVYFFISMCAWLVFGSATLIHSEWNGEQHFTVTLAQQARIALMFPVYHIHAYISASEAGAFGWPQITAIICNSLIWGIALYFILHSIHKITEKHHLRILIASASFWLFILLILYSDSVLEYQQAMKIKYGGPRIPAGFVFHMPLYLASCVCAFILSIFSIVYTPKARRWHFKALALSPLCALVIFL